jgi:aspartyl-tRNA(Asn)/glutamyl-tRNA(Gln) amidotransferase subunit C
MIDDRVVAHVARLGRLDLSDAERQTLRVQLGSILEHFRQLDALDLTGVPATSHVLPMANVLRDDVPRPSLPREDVLANAPATENGYIVVPPVIETE